MKNELPFNKLDFPLAIDATSLQDGSRNRGIGSYTEQLLLGLNQLNLSQSIYLILREDQAYPPLLTTLSSNFKTLSYRISGGHGSEMKQKERAIQHLIATVPLRIIHFPAQYCFVKTKLPSVLTIHDTIPLIFMKMFYNTDFIGYARDVLHFRSLMRQVDHVITISEQSKKDIQKFSGIATAKISVIHNGLDPFFTTFQPTPEMLAQAMNDNHIPQPYLLYVGSIEPRKNIKRLLEAFAKLVQLLNHEADFSQDQLHSLKLVLLGKKETPYLKEIDKLAKKLQIENRLIIRGFVAKAELACLYQQAKAFFFPTLYEGFGYPPLEAMSCGTPVVASHSPPLPEILGHHALFTDPWNPLGMAYDLLTVLKNESFKKEMIRGGKEQVKQYNYIDAAKKFLQVHASVLASYPY